MPTRPRPRLNLRTLLLAFALTSAIATLANTFWVMFTTQKAELVENALQTNEAYASRIATGVEEVLRSDLDRLQFVSSSISQAFTDQPTLQKEAHRLLRQDTSFNSVLISNAEGKIIASAPSSLQLDGQMLQRRSPLLRREPMISDAFQSLAGNLVVFVSHPVFSQSGEYLGLVGGSIRLEQKNTIQALMDLNIRNDGAHVYLVDSQRRVLYHPDPKRIGTVLATGPIVDAALKQSHGSMQAPDGNGNEMLAGYASIPSSHWGVISQRPLSNIQARLEATTIKVAKGIAPLGLFGLLVIWWLGLKISVPLSRLAESAKRLDAPESYDRILAVPADYFESWQIRRALLLGANLLQEKIGRLNHQAQSDPLTGLANRRAMEETLELWQETLETFATISMDIDHFKRVNDTYGHGAGDETLRAMARLMRQASRPDDLACRIGGEEFLLLLPNSSISTAAEVAERLRTRIEATDFDTVGHITISLGVALWRKGESISATLEKSDRLLYQAKAQGRNRVVSEKELPATTR
ncbi:sensor domain-containing diguanylate cyclase [Pseudomonas sp. MWU13-3659]|uniref:GGDEF domain-containing protein n=1 Tax=Pseudomonas sp. MWU13-3659 TaxID=2986964 RepID=UPI002074E0C7|nr:sensor domain-containing diguanylate cyclase [Pseudomonas sp. MWU13-3659]